MNTNTVTRKDPMADVMPFELLQVANSLMERRQTEAYWAKVPVPKRPVGQVRFEVARQVATFAVPAFGIAVASMASGLTGFMLGLPVALLTGYLMDKQLENAINKKCRADEEVDAGRYRAVKWLSEQMGMPQAEITLDVIRKMAKDYFIVKKHIDAELARREQERKAVRAPRRFGKGAAVAAGAAVAGTVAGASYVDEDGVVTINPATGLPLLPDSMLDVAGNSFGTGGQFGLPDVNPTSGLPMVQDTFVDVGGNVFGTPD